MLAFTLGDFLVWLALARPGWALTLDFKHRLVKNGNCQGVKSVKCQQTFALIANFRTPWRRHSSSFNTINYYEFRLANSIGKPQR